MADMLRDRTELAVRRALPAWLPLWYRERRIKRAMADWDTRNSVTRLTGVAGCITSPTFDGPIVAIVRGRG